MALHVPSPAFHYLWNAWEILECSCLSGILWLNTFEHAYSYIAGWALWFVGLHSSIADIFIWHNQYVYKSSLRWKTLLFLAPQFLVFWIVGTMILLTFVMQENAKHPTPTPSRDFLFTFYWFIYNHTLSGSDLLGDLRQLPGKKSATSSVTYIR